MILCFTEWWDRWYISKSNAFFRAKKRKRNKKVNHLYVSDDSQYLILQQMRPAIIQKIDKIHPKIQSLVEVFFKLTEIK